MFSSSQASPRSFISRTMFSISAIRASKSRVHVLLVKLELGFHVLRSPEVFVEERQALVHRAAGNAWFSSSTTPSGLSSFSLTRPSSSSRSVT